MKMRATTSKTAVVLSLLAMLLLAATVWWAVIGHKLSRFSPSATRFERELDDRGRWRLAQIRTRFIRPERPRLCSRA